MSYGISCTPATGAPLVSPDALGAIFVGKVECTITSGTQTLDYPNVPFGGLYAVQYGDGIHTWAITNNGGASRLTFTYAKETYQTARNTILYIYANNTTEPSYGVNVTNSAGQRVISTVYPNLRYVTSVAIDTSSVAAYDPSPAEYSWRAYTNTFSYTPTSVNHSAVVFWTLPSTATLNWYLGRPSVVGTGASTKGLLYIKTASATLPTTYPTAYVFEAGPYMAVTSTYGIRVFNASGQVMYDGATPSLVIHTMITTIDLSAAGTTYTLPSGITPAFLFPQYIKEGPQGGCADGYSTRKEEWGMFRRNGTTLYADIIRMYTEAQDWDCRESATAYYYGNRTGLVLPIINAAAY